MAIRTDMAEEAYAGDFSKIEGVQFRKTSLYQFPLTKLEVQSTQAAEKIGKPMGKYRTLYMERYFLRREGSFQEVCRAFADCIREVLPASGTILVAGLGNEAMTPDAVGTQVLKKLCITRHLRENAPADFRDLRAVACIAPGVLGTTGMESAELVLAAAERIRPACVVAVDALASRSLERLCTCVQITDTGIVPGSGVGNARAAFTKESLGVPVIAVGVPTVVDAATMVQELTGKTENLPEMASDMMVTPREIDARVADAAKVIGFGLNLAFQRNLTPEDIELLVE